MLIKILNFTYQFELVRVTIFRKLWKCKKSEYFRVILLVHFLHSPLNQAINCLIIYRNVYKIHYKIVRLIFKVFKCDVTGNLGTV